MTKRETIKFIVQMIASIATDCKYRNGDCYSTGCHLVHGCVKERDEVRNVMRTSLFLLDS